MKQTPRGSGSRGTGGGRGAGAAARGAASASSSVALQSGAPDTACLVFCVTARAVPISQSRLVPYLIFLPLFLEQINKMLQSGGQSLRKHQKPYNKQLMSGSSLAHLIFPN